jgi:hypothetical protein
MFIDGQSLVRKAVGPQVGKVVQGTRNHTVFVAFSANGYRIAQDVRRNRPRYSKQQHGYNG